MSTLVKNRRQQTIGPVEDVTNLKFVLLGDVGVGKSSLATRFVRGYFTENGSSTVGAAYFTQVVATEDRSIRFDIWDTAGQERFHCLAPMYYRGAQAAVVVYDITDVKTFDRAKEWVKEVRQRAQAKIVIILVGNKTDMATEKRAISREDGQAYAENNNLLFTETSAKTGMSVQEMFLATSLKVIKQGSPTVHPRGLDLLASSDSAGKKKCAC